MSKGIRLLVASLVVSAGALLLSAPAGAIQTTTWGLEPAPAGQTQRSDISHAADGSTVHDAVIVYNRTAQPMTVRLYVLATTYQNGVYKFGSPDTGLAAQTGLGMSSVALGPRQQVRVPVTLHMPRGLKSTELAAIGAEAGAVNDGALSIQQQLVIIVKATPTSHVLPIVGKNLLPWSIVAIAVLGGAAVLVERERRSRRRSVAPATGGVSSPARSRVMVDA